MKKHYNITIHGRVQGVMFRTAARAEAIRLGVKGLARNNSDGSVYIEAEGEEDVIEQFLMWCHHGPSHADIERVEIVPHHVKNLSLFRIMGATQ